jgi:hypothetical protein
MRIPLPSPRKFSARRLPKAVSNRIKDLADKLSRQKSVSDLDNDENSLIDDTDTPVQSPASTDMFISVRQFSYDWESTSDISDGTNVHHDFRNTSTRSLGTGMLEQEITLFRDSSGRSLGSGLLHQETNQVCLLDEAMSSSSQPIDHIKGYTPYLCVVAFATASVFALANFQLLPVSLTRFQLTWMSVASCLLLSGYVWFSNQYSILSEASSILDDCILDPSLQFREKHIAGTFSKTDSLSEILIEFLLRNRVEFVTDALVKSQEWEQLATRLSRFADRVVNKEQLETLWQEHEDLPVDQRIVSVVRRAVDHEDVFGS